MFVLNPRRRVALFNQGCEALSGWTAAELLGQRAEVVSSDDPQTLEALLATLMPPAEVWRGLPWATRVEWPRRDGSTMTRVIHFWPIATATEPVSAVLGIVGPPAEQPPVAEPTLSQALHRELTQWRQESRKRYGERSVIGRCPAMLRVQEQLRLARLATTPVVLRGPAGAGKEHVARSLHAGSLVARRLFVSIPLEETPATEVKRLLKQLTSADERGGRDVAALPGSLYLHPIEQAPADVQERLLEWLSGGTEPAVRLITGTAQGWEREVAEGRFSAELALRLSPLTIELPPLRERGEDITLLAQHFLEEANRGSERQVAGFEPAVAEGLRRYRWPGEVDELQKVMREAHAACMDGLLREAQLPFRFRAGVEAQRLGPPPVRGRSLDKYLADLEREELARVLELAGGNMTLAAQLLELPRARLYRRCEQLGLRSPDGADLNRDASDEGARPTTEESTADGSS